MPRRASIALADLIFATAFGFWQWRILAPVHLPQPINFWNSDLYTTDHTFQTRRSPRRAYGWQGRRAALRFPTSTIIATTDSPQKRATSLV
jgi:hypothetical protein